MPGHATSTKRALRPLVLIGRASTQTLTPAMANAAAEAAMVLRKIDNDQAC